MIVLKLNLEETKWGDMFYGKSKYEGSFEYKFWFDWKWRKLRKII